MIWCREPGDADRFVRVLVKAGAGVLGAGEALGEVPSEVIQACVRHGIALLAVPAETSFAAVTEEVARRLNGDRATAMTRVLGRRRLLAEAIVAMLASDGAAPGRAAAHPGRVPGLLRLMERMRGQDVRPRQHRSVPDPPDRRAHRA